MSKTYRLGVVLMAGAFVITVASLRPVYGQQFKINAGSNQSDKDKKDKKDKDEDNKDRKKDKDRDNNSQNDQGNQNDQNNQGQGGNSNNAKKSGSSQFQQLMKQGQGQNNQGQGQNFQGQGNQNKFGGNNKIGVPGQQFQQNQKFKDFKFDDDDDHGHDHKKMAFGSWRGDKWEGSNKVGNWAQAFGYKKTSIFGDKWYRDHPQAWKYDNNKANVWVTATVPGVYSWLGWGTMPPQYQAYYANAPMFDASPYGDWYPLGVFSLMSNSDDMGTRIVQLAVDRHGHLAGTYFDMITDAENSIVGEINRQTQRAEWSLRRNPDVTFRASIYRLLQPSGYVTVQLPGGDQRWQFVRLEN